MGLSFAVEFAFAPASGTTTMQRGIETEFNEALAHTLDSREAAIEGIADRLVRPSRAERAAVSFEQDLGVGANTAGDDASLHQLGQLITFSSSQGHDVLRGHDVPPGNRE